MTQPETNREENRNGPDLVRATFENLRATAKRRGGNVPRLSGQGKNVVPRRSVGKLAVAMGADEPAAPEISVPGLDLAPEPAQKRRFQRGRPTGPDGRPLQREYSVVGFGSLLKKEISQREWTEPIAHGWVMGNWEALVGEKIAQHTEVSMIKDGELFISCDQTAWATNLKYMQSTVLSQIAEKIGPGVITKLHVYPPKTKNWRYGPLHVKGRGPRDTYG